MARPLGKRLKSANTDRSELRAMVLSIDSHEADRRHRPYRSGEYAAPPRRKGHVGCHDVTAVRIELWSGNVRGKTTQTQVK